MRLNLQSDYALRLLMQLAVNLDQLVTISEVADSFGISKNHLTKVAHLLARGGYIETVRGRSGGLRLGRPASRLGVGAVIRMMEADFAVVECLPGGSNQCKITPVCQLKYTIHQALEAFMDVLDQYTIEDMVKNNDELLTLLHQP